MASAVAHSLPRGTGTGTTKEKEEGLGWIVGAGEALLPVEEMEHLLDDVLGTLVRIEAKCGRLQEQIAVASRGKQRAHHNRRAAPAPAAAEGDVPPPAYTRKSAQGAVRKRLRAAAGEAKQEKERLEEFWGELQEAIADARQRVPLPPPRAVA